MIASNADVVQNNSRDTASTIDLGGAYTSQLAASAAVNKFTSGPAAMNRRSLRRSRRIRSICMPA